MRVDGRAIPIPGLDGMLNMMAKLVINLRSGYHQIRIRDGNDCKTTFTRDAFMNA